MQLAATTRLKNLRAQLESKLEMVMSDRLRVFLDLDVKAPHLVIPIELATTAGDVVVSHAGDVAAASAVGGHRETSQPEESPIPRDGSGSAGGGGIGGGGGGGRRRDHKCTPVSSSSRSPFSTTRELLVVDLGSVSLATSRLAYLRNTKEQQQESDERDGVLLSASSGSSENGDRFSSGGWGRTPLRGLRLEQVAGGSDGGDREDRGEKVSANTTTPTGWMKARVSSSVGPAGEATGKRWHANFYDVYNVDVSRVGVLLKRDADDGSSHTSGGGGGGRDKKLDLGANGIGIGGWLVDPFDVKVGETVCSFW